MSVGLKEGEKREEGKSKHKQRTSKLLKKMPILIESIVYPVLILFFWVPVELTRIAYSSTHWWHIWGFDVSLC